MRYPYSECREYPEPRIIQVSRPDSYDEQSVLEPYIYQPRSPSPERRRSHSPASPIILHAQEPSEEDLIKIVRQNPARVVESAEEMTHSVRKARLILYHAQRAIRLRGDERDAYDREVVRLDKALGRLESHLRRPRPEIRYPSTRAVLLRLDMDFRGDVIEPLKAALYDRSQPDFSALRHTVNQMRCAYKEIWNSLERMAC
ncbi:hypothetical protein CkaCkLH20_02912 [Colletotrichum karsti]|uniref:Uncharacterized protein n=1 Tax=Colletotrichum karsti TaxID=1095194 RepID=A0A9P6IBC2_9PEZI|nr:uncharacterized protein CkaCkLH20_02912 [Colletotrichum karsti]KAF9879369.1 hypothetical protein CkaCkLH20_02912 [Colletotrichum karsti]